MYSRSGQVERLGHGRNLNPLYVSVCLSCFDSSDLFSVKLLTVSDDGGSLLDDMYRKLANGINDYG